MLPPPLAALIGKAFFFREASLGRPHPPQQWGGRVDVAKRLAPPPSATNPVPPGMTVTASLTDNSIRQAARTAMEAGALIVDGQGPQDVLLTATAEGAGAWTYMLGYDVGANCGIVRLGAATPRAALAATYFSNGHHVRMEAAADLVRGGGGGGGGGKAAETAWGPASDAAADDACYPSSSSSDSGPGGWAVSAWGAATANDGAAQANSTACNLAEREVGFVVAPFTARTSTAALALRLGGRGAGAGCGSGDGRAAAGGPVPCGPGSPAGGWAVEGALDVQAMQAFWSVEAPVRLGRRTAAGTLAVRYAATSGVGLLEFTAGGPPVDTSCPSCTAAAAAGVAAAAGGRPRRGRLPGWLGRLGRVKAFVKADAGPGRAWLGRPAFGLIVDRAIEL